MISVRTAAIALTVACIALPGCAGCGSQTKKPVAVHPDPKPVTPPEFLDDQKHRDAALAAARAFAQKKYPGKLDFDHPRPEFLGGHALAVAGANPGKLVMKDAPVGTWRVCLRVLKAAPIVDATITPETAQAGEADPNAGANIAERVFLVRPDLSVIETQGLPSLAPASAPIVKDGTTP
jgi:hypothetical protein